MKYSGYRFIRRSNDNLFSLYHRDPQEFGIYPSDVFHEMEDPVFILSGKRSRIVGDIHQITVESVDPRLYGHQLIVVPVQTFLDVISRRGLSGYSLSSLDAREIDKIALDLIVGSTVRDTKELEAAYSEEKYFRYVVVPQTGEVFVEETRKQGCHMGMLIELDLVKCTPDPPSDCTFTKGPVKLGAVVYEEGKVGIMCYMRYYVYGLDLHRDSLLDVEIYKIFNEIGIPEDTEFTIVERWG